MMHDNTPVLVGVAQRSWPQPDTGRTPLDALEEVALAAFDDAGCRGLRGAVDALVHVPFLLTQLPELAPLMPRNSGAALAERLDLAVTQYSAVTGGNLPQELVNRLAQKVAAGEHRVALLCGAELLNTLFGALRSGAAAPDWTTGASAGAELLSDLPDTMTAPAEYAHGLREPIVAYPLFESALRHAKGLDLAAHQQLLGELASGMSRVAAANPLAWKRDILTPAQALSEANGNRMICWPYTKAMNAIAGVDMAAAALLTTVATARELGVPEERWVYLWGGADTHDTWLLSERAELHRSPALRVAVDAVFVQTGLCLEDIDLFDLYSCFPAAIQVACDALGLALDDPRGVTVTGGMTRFGGPGNNYSLHAIAEMVQRLRAAPQQTGLITANGGFLTKHSVGVYAARPPQRPWRAADRDALQAPLDSLAHPVLADRADGAMTVAAATVRYSRGEPAVGVLLGTLDDGRRCVALSEEDPQLFRRLCGEDCVGLRGRVRAEDTVNRFRFT